MSSYEGFVVKKNLTFLFSVLHVVFRISLSPFLLPPISLSLSERVSEKCSLVCICVCVCVCVCAECVLKLRLPSTSLFLWFIVNNPNITLSLWEKVLNRNGFQTHVTIFEPFQIFPSLTKCEGVNHFVTPVYNP